MWEIHNTAKVHAVDLENGQIMAMEGLTQQHYQHRILVSRDAAKPRLAYPYLTARKQLSLMWRRRNVMLPFDKQRGSPEGRVKEASQGEKQGVPNTAETKAYEG